MIWLRGVLPDPALRGQGQWLGVLVRSQVEHQKKHDVRFSLRRGFWHAGDLETVLAYRHARHEERRRARVRALEAAAQLAKEKERATAAAQAVHQRIQSARILPDFGAATGLVDLILAPAAEWHGAILGEFMLRERPFLATEVCRFVGERFPLHPSCTSALAPQMQAAMKRYWQAAYRAGLVRLEGAHPFIRPIRK